MIVIWKIIRNFAVEKFNKMPMDYRHIKVLHHLTSSFNSLLPQTCGKQMKRSKQKGITLIALVITIIILVILSTMVTQVGMSSIKNSRFERIKI